MDGFARSSFAQYEVGNVDAVLDGELDDFIEAYRGGTLIIDKGWHT